MPPLGALEAECFSWIITSRNLLALQSQLQGHGFYLVLLLNYYSFWPKRCSRTSWVVEVLTSHFRTSSDPFLNQRSAPQRFESKLSLRWVLPLALWKCILSNNLAGTANNGETIPSFLSLPDSRSSCSSTSILLIAYYYLGGIYSDESEGAFSCIRRYQAQSWGFVSAWLDFTVKRKFRTQVYHRVPCPNYP